MFEEEIIIYIILLLMKKIQHIKKEKTLKFKQTIYEDITEAKQKCDV